MGWGSKGLADGLGGGGEGGIGAQALSRDLAGVTDGLGVAVAEGGTERRETGVGEFPSQKDGEVARNDEVAMPVGRSEGAGRNAEFSGDGPNNGVDGGGWGRFGGGIVSECVVDELQVDGASFDASGEFESGEPAFEGSESVCGLGESVDDGGGEGDRAGTGAFEQETASEFGARWIHGDGEST
jgi:hypothetical protein